VRNNQASASRTPASSSTMKTLAWGCRLLMRES
jgi:hypothetical protein